MNSHNSQNSTNSTNSQNSEHNKKHNNSVNGAGAGATSDGCLLDIPTHLLLGKSVTTGAVRSDVGSVISQNHNHPKCLKCQVYQVYQELIIFLYTHIF